VGPRADLDTMGERNFFLCQKSNPGFSLFTARSLVTVVTELKGRSKNRTILNFRGVPLSLAEVV
jgi:hypothetical protein